MHVDMLIQLYIYCIRLTKKNLEKVYARKRSWERLKPKPTMNLEKTIGGI